MNVDGDGREGEAYRHARNEEEVEETQEGETSGAGPEAYKKSVAPAPAESFHTQGSGSQETSEGPWKRSIISNERACPPALLLSHLLAVQRGPSPKIGCAPPFVGTNDHAILQND
jgi:hypothetical protein